MHCGHLFKPVRAADMSTPIIEVMVTAALKKLKSAHISLCAYSCLLILKVIDVCIVDTIFKPVRAADMSTPMIEVTVTAAL